MCKAPEGRYIGRNNMYKLSIKLPRYSLAVEEDLFYSTANAFTFSITTSC